MFCFGQTFAAKVFKGTRAFVVSEKRCLDLLGDDVKKCAITETALHQAFQSSSSSQKFIEKRQALLNKCHSCAAMTTDHIRTLATMAPTPAAQYVSPCEMRCVAIINKQFRMRAYTHACTHIGADVCGVVKKKTGKVPTSYFHDDDVEHIGWNVCFCQRHCHHNGNTIGAPLTCDSNKQSLAEHNLLQTAKLDGYHQHLVCGVWATASTPECKSYKKPKVTKKMLEKISTMAPSAAPTTTVTPTLAPTFAPTLAPSARPTSKPTHRPTHRAADPQADPQAPQADGISDPQADGISNSKGSTVCDTEDSAIVPQPPCKTSQKNCLPNHFSNAKGSCNQEGKQDVG
jgi:hypothetical protein